MVEVQIESGMGLHEREVASGERFEFGKNWSRFLELIDEDRITRAEKALKNWLEVEDLNGKSFLDIGSGSGMDSLAARRLGARVHSFDYDPHSVACTMELRRRYFPGDPNWTIEEGSALDAEYLKSLGSFDIVYSWGVLHHTGQMWKALDNAMLPVSATGKLFIAIYNDMGTQSARWKSIKRMYNSLPGVLKLPFTMIVMAPAETKSLLRAIATLRIREYVRSWIDPRPERGMSRGRDVVDWVGGYPYEVARPEEIFDFYRAHNFSLTRMQCGGVGLGCNQFVFEKQSRLAKRVGSGSF